MYKIPPRGTSCLGRDDRKETLGRDDSPGTQDSDSFTQDDSPAAT